MDTTEDQIVAAYANGEDVHAIAARFGTTTAHIEHIIAVTTADPPATFPPPAGHPRFNPPPGWPPSPDGWLPPPGWRPDPSWPPPPPGWPLYVTGPAPASPEQTWPAQGQAWSKPPAASDPIDQLRRLGELRDQGIVTEQEFAAKKAEILGRM